MHFDVLEGVLFDVPDSEVGVLLYFSGSWDSLAGEKFDEG
jgi:hypothetical protein